MPVAGQGSIHISDVSRKIKEINPVLYDPGVCTSLFSVGKLIDIGYRVLFESKQCLIYDKDDPNQLFLLGTCDARNNLYKIEWHPIYLGMVVQTLAEEPTPIFDLTNTQSCTNQSIDSLLTAMLIPNPTAQSPCWLSFRNSTMAQKNWTSQLSKFIPPNNKSTCCKSSCYSTHQTCFHWSFVAWCWM